MNRLKTRVTTLYNCPLMTRAGDLVTTGTKTPVGQVLMWGAGVVAATAAVPMVIAGAAALAPFVPVAAASTAMGSLSAAHASMLIQTSFTVLSSTKAYLTDPKDGKKKACKIIAGTMSRSGVGVLTEALVGSGTLTGMVTGTFIGMITSAGTTMIMDEIAPAEKVPEEKVKETLKTKEILERKPMLDTMLDKPAHVDDVTWLATLNAHRNKLALLTVAGAAAKVYYTGLSKEDLTYAYALAKNSAYFKPLVASAATKVLSSGVGLVGTGVHSVFDKAVHAAGIDAMKGRLVQDAYIPDATPEFMRQMLTDLSVAKLAAVTGKTLELGVNVTGNILSAQASQSFADTASKWTSAAHARQDLSRLAEQASGYASDLAATGAGAIESMTAGAMQAIRWATPDALVKELPSVIADREAAEAAIRAAFDAARLAELEAQRQQNEQMQAEARNKFEQAMADRKERVRLEDERQRAEAIKRLQEEEAAVQRQREAEQLAAQTKAERNAAAQRYESQKKAAKVQNMEKIGTMLRAFEKEKQDAALALVMEKTRKIEAERTARAAAAALAKAQEAERQAIEAARARAELARAELARAEKAKADFTKARGQWDQDLHQKREAALVEAQAKLAEQARLAHEAARTAAIAEADLKMSQLSMAERIAIRDPKVMESPEMKHAMNQFLATDFGKLTQAQLQTYAPGDRPLGLVYVMGKMYAQHQIGLGAAGHVGSLYSGAAKVVTAVNMVDTYRDAVVLASDVAAAHSANVRAGDDKVEDDAIAKRMHTQTDTNVLLSMNANLRALNDGFSTVKTELQGLASSLQAAGDYVHQLEQNLVGYDGLVAAMRVSGYMPEAILGLSTGYGGLGDRLSAAGEILVGNKVVSGVV